MRKVAENSIATSLRTLTAKTFKPLEEGSSNDIQKQQESQPNAKPNERTFSKVSRNILQLLRNELKLLEMLLHSCKEFKNTLLLNNTEKEPETVESTENSKDEIGKPEPQSVAIKADETASG